MANYKYYFGNGFAGCRLLAETYDNHRSRKVRVFQVPGEWDTVGVTDGVDSWIAPVAADPFRVNVADLLKRIRAGEAVAVVQQAKPTRHRLIDETAPQTHQDAPRRRRLLVEG